MPLTNDTAIFTDWVYDKINDNRVALGMDPALKNVFYGDPQKIPYNPIIAVESGEQTETPNKIPRGVWVVQNIYIIIYHSKIQEIEEQRRENDQLMVAVKNLLHEDHMLHTDPPANTDRLALNSLVTQSEPGTIQKGQTLYRASRLTFEIQSQVQLPC